MACNNYIVCDNYINVSLPLLLRRHDGNQNPGSCLFTKSRFGHSLTQVHTLQHNVNRGPLGANVVPQEISSVSFPSSQDEFRWWDVLVFLFEGLFFFYTFPEHDADDTLLKFDCASGCIAQSIFIMAVFLEAKCLAGTT